MKYMIIIKATPESEAGIMPSAEVFEAMAKFNEALIDAGASVAGEGLQSSSKGARVRYSKGRHTVVDGPFAETKELIAGFRIIDVKSKEEAIDWAKKIPLDEGEEVEIRKVWEAADWEEAGAPDGAVEADQRLREKEKAQRE